MSNPQRLRVGKILKLIANQPGITLAEVVKELGRQGIAVSKKTVTKDIKSLKSDFCVLPDRERLKSGYVLTEMLTVGSAEIGIVIDALNAFSINLKEESADKVVHRFEEVLKTTMFRASSKTGIKQEQIYEYDADQTEYIRMLNEAADRQLAVRVKYKSPRSAEQVYTGYPLWKLFHERGWYYIHRTLGHDTFFSWRLDRIKDCEILAAEAVNSTHVEDLKTAKFLVKNGWGMSFPPNLGGLQSQNLVTITVRFDVTAAGFIKEGRRRHPRATISDCATNIGCVDFQVKLPKECHGEFRSWVRSWGSKAQFLAPQDFVDRERLELTAWLKKYN